MVAPKRYTPEEKQKLIEEFNASGKSLNAFCKEPGRPSYPVFTKWVKPTAENLSSPVSSEAYNPSLYAQFQQTLMPEDPRDKYIDFLEQKVVDLTAKLDELLKDNA
ncbi:hypothetical protein [Pseudomonas halotolerans]|uniref:hypothetical protein n=1 Tax=Pseudomonas halotolerans TaxID=3143552 RepID=UPI0031CFF7EF